jgi:hypothetical protein
LRPCDNGRSAEGPQIQHRQLVAGAFRVFSYALGIPSSIAFVFLAFSAIRLQLLTPAPSAEYASGDKLIDLFVSGFRVMGKLIEFFGGAAKLAITVLAVATFLCLVIALFFFFTSRGLYAGRPWARVLGILLAIFTLLISLGAFVSVGRPISHAVPALTAALSVYVIWTLGWHYS